MAKSTLAGVGTFFVLLVFVYYGVITQWTFVPRENVAIAVEPRTGATPRSFHVGISSNGRAPTCVGITLREWTVLAAQVRTYGISYRV
jgi:hypothetical protein